MTQWTFVLVAGLLLVADPAAATGPLAGEGKPIATSDYTIDLYRGPVLAGSRVVGLAGAYESIAEGVAGYFFNPAAVANRVPWSQTWFDWDLDGGFTLPASVTDFDFDNNGDDSFNNSAAFFATGGFGLQFGNFGIGLIVDWQLYQVDSRATSAILNVGVVQTMLVGGHSFMKGELVIGLGLSVDNVSIGRAIELGEEQQEKGEIGAAKGGALHLGALWAPAYLPLRVGVSTRLSAPPEWTPDARPNCVAPLCQEVDGDFIADEFYYLPKKTVLPNEILAGATVQLFRPLNFPWVAPENEEHNEKIRVQRANKKAQIERREQRDKELKEARRVGKDTQPIEVKWRAEEAKMRPDEAKAVLVAAEVDRTRRLALYKAMPRGKLLISAGVKVTLPTQDGVGLDSFLRQQVERSGETVTAQPHVGVEGEVWPGYLVVRAGSYLEPSRFRRGSSRFHATGGLDIRIPLEWSVFGLLDDDTTFRISSGVDYTTRYFGWGAGVGIWR